MTWFFWILSVSIGLSEKWVSQIHVPICLMAFNWAWKPMRRMKLIAGELMWTPNLRQSPCIASDIIIYCCWLVPNVSPIVVASARKIASLELCGLLSFRLSNENRTDRADMVAIWRSMGRDDRFRVGCWESPSYWCVGYMKQWVALILKHTVLLLQT